jgi:hypothetical protein
MALAECRALVDAVHSGIVRNLAINTPNTMNATAIGIP